MMDWVWSRMTLNELGFHPGVRGSCYIAPEDAREPLDQTDLDGWTRLLLIGGYEPTLKQRLTGGPTRAAAARP